MPRKASAHAGFEQNAPASLLRVLPLHNQCDLRHAPRSRVILFKTRLIGELISDSLFTLAAFIHEQPVVLKFVPVVPAANYSGPYNTIEYNCVASKEVMQKVRNCYPFIDDDETKIAEVIAANNARIATRR